MMPWFELDSLSKGWTERRKTQRFAIVAPVSLQWREVDGRQRHCDGVTSNLSAQGVLVETETLPGAVSFIEVAVDLSRSHIAGASLRFRGKGNVVRVQARENGAGSFAAHIHFEIAKGTSL